MTTPAIPASNTLLGLPGELRNLIYEFVLATYPQPGPGSMWPYLRGPSIFIRNWPPDCGNMWREPSLLLACKQIRREASGIYYGMNDFVLRPETTELQQACDWLRRRSHIARRPFRSLIFYVPDASYRELPYYYPLLFLHYDTDIELGPGRVSIDGQKTIFEVLHRSGVGDAMMYVVRMGRRARLKGLTREELVIAFQLWVQDIQDGWEAEKIRKRIRKGPRDPNLVPITEAVSRLQLS